MTFPPGGLYGQQGPHGPQYPQYGGQPQGYPPYPQATQQPYGQVPYGRAPGQWPEPPGKDPLLGAKLLAALVLGFFAIVVVALLVDEFSGPPAPADPASVAACAEWYALADQVDEGYLDTLSLEEADAFLDRKVDTLQALASGSGDAGLRSAVGTWAGTTDALEAGLEVTDAEWDAAVDGVTSACRTAGAS